MQSLWTAIFGRNDIDNTHKQMNSFCVRIFTATYSRGVSSHFIIQYSNSSCLLDKRLNSLCSRHHPKRDSGQPSVALILEFKPPPIRRNVCVASRRGAKFRFRRARDAR